jgi:predicted RNA-binding Zn-ribbon protein involved in translation (DUF1610 family)
VLKTKLRCESCGSNFEEFEETVFECPSCSTQLAEGSAECDKCGEKFVWDEHKDAGGEEDADIEQADTSDEESILEDSEAIEEDEDELLDEDEDLAYFLDDDEDFPPPPEF